MSRFLSLSASAAAMGILFACSQQVSDAQEEDTPPAMAEDNAPGQEINPGDEDTGQASIPSMMRATGDILGDEGDSIGDINLIEGPNGVLIEVNISADGLAPGWHGLHLHQTGDCSDTGEYTASGGHVGKVEGGHGLLNMDGPEPGDLPNIYAADDGSAHMEAFTTFATLSEVMDDDGGAMIIHEGRDDHMSQPIGGAGSRVACAVIQ